MKTQDSLGVVKEFFEAMGRLDRAAMLKLAAENFEWVIPGDSWPLAGIHRGHAGLVAFLDKASTAVETTFSGEPEYVSQGDRVLMIGSATGTINATKKSFKDDWVFSITVKNGKLVRLQEYVDTQALARAASKD